MLGGSVLAESMAAEAGFHADVSRAAANCEDCPPASGTSGALKSLAGHLQAALTSSDAPGVLALLDALAKTARDGGKEELCADSLAEACLVCSGVVQSQWGSPVRLAQLGSYAACAPLMTQAGSVSRGLGGACAYCTCCPPHDSRHPAERPYCCHGSSLHTTVTAW